MIKLYCNKKTIFNRDTFINNLNNDLFEQYNNHGYGDIPYMESLPIQSVR